MDIYAKYLGGEPKCINATINGRPFFISKDDIGNLNWAMDQYQFDSMCWEGNIITQIWENKYGWFDFSKNLVDIGAGCGEYPIFAGFAHSYAFEPNKTKQCFLYANMLSHDKVYDVDVLPYCIGDVEKVEVFNGWTSDTDTRFGDAGVTVEYRTLDSFNIENVGLIKIDIEGFEYYAVKSGLGTIIRNEYPPMLLEIWNDADMEGYFGDRASVYMERRKMLLDMLYRLGYVMINDPELGDWETKFFIHMTRLNGYNPGYRANRIL